MRRSKLQTLCKSSSLVSHWTEINNIIKLRSSLTDVHCELWSRVHSAAPFLLFTASVCHNHVRPFTHLNFVSREGESATVSSCCFSEKPTVRCGWRETRGTDTSLSFHRATSVVPLSKSFSIRAVREHIAAGCHVHALNRTGDGHRCCRTGAHTFFKSVILLRCVCVGGACSCVRVWKRH